MEKLTAKIEQYRKPLKQMVKEKLAYFKKNKEARLEEWFSELCYCIMASVDSDKVSLKIQKKLGYSGFIIEDRQAFAKKLRELGYTHALSAAKNIDLARDKCDVKEIVTSFDKEKKAREWIFKNVEGFGRKDASRFLRNVGYENLAILDNTILGAMKKYEVIKRIPKKISRRDYFAFESKLQEIADELGMSLAELDLYIRFIVRGKVIK